ncbi:hypothetical protein [Klebsiella pneumoniae]|uniref:hypothetical protein n=1 Tax=Klebsiella pneumoniae TaxID=573 RepID=UPI0002AADEA4|nr:hypothetical protein [Klebsiella pneumoniae]HDT0647946.1 hypothetical protein [Klebsiella pneumoniae subsp. ozaenae]EKU9005308.1 hypothetical protein [Klebsiella pneumoniae]EKW8560313.1 hypothetical protein [Klebsiella pneumoniae]ELA1329106.1 hypothetical protein [Klebsiella pneumoniae]EMC2595157.1 hypothetical protein [Klebsiella pneumoniae]
MNIETVNELIRSLESAGELSIKETKVMALAKAYKQLAAENVELKATSDDRRTFIMNGVQLGYIKLPKDENGQALETIRIAVSQQKPTPATDRIVAEAEARGVEKAIAHLEKKFSNIGVQIMNLQWLADSLRKGSSE